MYLNDLLLKEICAITICVARTVCKIRHVLDVYAVSIYRL